MSSIASSTSSASVTVSPVPTDEEAAAIVSAMEVLWPRTLAADEALRHRHPAWKFSGRWWSVPLPARRARPWM